MLLYLDLPNILRRRAQAFANSLGYTVQRIHKTPESFREQLRLLRGEASVIVDGGANEGQTAIRYSELFPRAAVHCFEPTAATFAALERRTSGFRNIHRHQQGLAESTGTRTFNVCRGSQMNSLLPVGPDGPIHMGGPLAEVLTTETVSVVTLDEFCSRSSISSVDILKLDIQGAELLALRGASGLLGANAIKLVYSEVLFAKLYEGQASFDDVWRFLEGFGYRLFRLYNLTAGVDWFHGFGDAIFLSPDMTQAVTNESLRKSRAV